MRNVQLYSSKPLPRNVQLKGNPHLREEATMLQMESLGILFYRDSVVTTPLVFETISDIEGFYSLGIFDDVEWGIDEWSDSTLKSATKEFEDSKSWLIHNSDVRILSVSNKCVMLGVLENGA
jgi:hypothetical protein